MFFQKQEKVIFLVLLFYAFLNIFQINNYNNKNNTIFSNSNSNFQKNRCYELSDKSNTKIIHVVITRFMIEFYHKNDFPKKLYNKDFMDNGIRVLKRYLLPSLEHQSCNLFIWVLMVGEKADINYIKSKIKNNKKFRIVILYHKDFRAFIKKITKGYDILITTRIDYDDMIYYDAVNDVRKAINLEKPMALYGYMHGFYYFEFNNKYYEFIERNATNGFWGIFESLIIVISDVNDLYSIYDLGVHDLVRKRLLNNYKSYGIKKLNYEPANFDNGAHKFVYVKQRYSTSYIKKDILSLIKNLKEIKFDIKKFFGY